MQTLKDLTKAFGEDKIVITCLIEDDLDDLLEENGETVSSEERLEIIRKASNLISGIAELDDIRREVLWGS